MGNMWSALDLDVSNLRDHVSVRSVLLAVFAIPVTYMTVSFVSQCIRASRLKKALAKVPGRPRHVLLGNLHDHPGPGPGTFTHMREVLKQFTRITQFWFGPFMPLCGVFHPDTVKVILKTSEPKYIDPNGTYTFLRPWLGDGLLLASGPRWFRNRRLLTPAFHFEILKPYIKVYNDATEKFIKKMREACKNGESVEIYSHVSLLTLDIILKCAFSYNAEVQTQGTRHPYVCAVIELSDLIVKRFFNPLLHFPLLFGLSRTGWKFRKACNYVHQVAEEIIANRKTALQQNNIEKKRYLDFLDILLAARDDEGRGLNDLEIRNEVDTFLFEGHDTTASGISWMLYEMAKHPDIQDKVREEVLQLAVQRENPEVMEWDDLSKLTYLTQCLRESMRVHPPVPGVMRQLSQDMVIDGHTIPKGMLIDINIYMLHHNPAVWGEDNMEYKPERFHPDKIKDMDPYAFVPFSAGPRNCIGQNFAMNEEKVVIAKILQSFELKLDPEHEALASPELVTRAYNGIKIVFTPRA